jgi:hypothetical protein
MYQMFFHKSNVADIQVEQPDTDIPVGCAFQRFVKSSGLKKGREPHEEIGALDMRIPDKKIMRRKCIRDCERNALVSGSFVADEPGYNNITAL